MNRAIDQAFNILLLSNAHMLSADEHHALIQTSKTIAQACMQCGPKRHLRVDLILKLFEHAKRNKNVARLRDRFEGKDATPFRGIVTYDVGPPNLPPALEACINALHGPNKLHERHADVLLDILKQEPNNSVYMATFVLVAILYEQTEVVRSLRKRPAKFALGTNERLLILLVLEDNRMHAQARGCGLQSCGMAFADAAAYAGHDPKRMKLLLGEDVAKVDTATLRRIVERALQVGNTFAAQVAWRVLNIRSNRGRHRKQPDADAPPTHPLRPARRFRVHPACVACAPLLRLMIHHGGIDLLYTHPATHVPFLLDQDDDDDDDDHDARAKLRKITMPSEIAQDTEAVAALARAICPMGSIDVAGAIKERPHVRMRIDNAICMLDTLHRALALQDFCAILTSIARHAKTHAHMRHVMRWISSAEFMRKIAELPYDAAIPLLDSALLSSVRRAIGDITSIVHAYAPFGREQLQQAIRSLVSVSSIRQVNKNGLRTLYNNIGRLLHEAARRHIFDQSQPTTLLDCMGDDMQARRRAWLLRVAAATQNKWTIALDAAREAKLRNERTSHWTSMPDSFLFHIRLDANSMSRQIKRQVEIARACFLVLLAAEDWHQAAPIR